ncbi:hypothetical protein GWI33_017307 [Rhynchophorus ferrugineus]|uniref:Uncharacterized protein n=1 Tax=Rhynchophorus ferrugineus TaxID=354439 RepID=A0A834HZ38_RHYFE|nr:hypothetical protein GWI33_017307 [Rhynchophorus ferrugineus]
MKGPKQNKRKHWISKYFNKILSIKNTQNIKNIALGTLSFVGGFMFYQKILSELVFEPVCDCRCLTCKCKRRDSQNPDNSEINPTEDNQSDTTDKN